MVGVGGRGDWEEDEEREGGERGAAGGGHWRSEWPGRPGAALGGARVSALFPACVLEKRAEGSGQGSRRFLRQVYKLQTRRAAAVVQTTQGDRQVFLVLFFFFFLQILFGVSFACSLFYFFFCFHTMVCMDLREYVDPKICC